MHFFFYRYTKRRANRGLTKIYWRCIERETCGGTITTNYNTHNGIILQKGQDHTHEEDHVQIQVEQIVRGIKRRPRQLPNAPPASIFRDEVATVSNS